MRFGRHPSARRVGRRCAATLTLTAMLALSACDRTPSILAQAKSQAAAASASGTAPASTLAPRALAAATLAAAFIPKGDLLPGDAIDDASTLLEQAAIAQSAGLGSIAQSTHATTYAGAVLDAIQAAQGQLNQSAEHEIFWTKVGRLAFRAAEEAFAAGRQDEALSLVLAGGTRWSNEAYWRRYADHDALAAVIFARSGPQGRAEAIRRLESRTELDGIALEILQSLRKGD